MSSSALNQPSDRTTSEIWSVFRRPDTTRAAKLVNFWIRWTCVLLQMPYTDMQYRMTGKTSAVMRYFTVAIGITCFAWFKASNIPVHFDTSWSTCRRKSRCWSNITPRLRTWSYPSCGPDPILVGTSHNLKKTSSFRINIAGHILTPSQSVKLLGVTLDRSLSWDEHICSVVKKCYSILVCLYKIWHHLTPEARKLLIQSHVFPHIL